jgi:hypothetical protein
VIWRFLNNQSPGFMRSVGYTQRIRVGVEQQIEVDYGPTRNENSQRSDNPCSAYWTYKQTENAGEQAPNKQNGQEHQQDKRCRGGSSGIYPACNCARRKGESPKACESCCLPLNRLEVAHPKRITSFAPTQFRLGKTLSSLVVETRHYHNVCAFCSPALVSMKRSLARPLSR